MNETLDKSHLPKRAQRAYEAAALIAKLNSRAQDALAREAEARAKKNQIALKGTLESAEVESKHFRRTPQNMIRRGQVGKSI